jgi:hypothetical protein
MSDMPLQCVTREAKHLTSSKPQKGRFWEQGTAAWSMLIWLVVRALVFMATPLDEYFYVFFGIEAASCQGEPVRKRADVKRFGRDQRVVRRRDMCQVVAAKAGVRVLEYGVPERLNQEAEAVFLRKNILETNAAKHGEGERTRDGGDGLPQR